MPCRARYAFHARYASLDMFLRNKDTCFKKQTKRTKRCPIVLSRLSSRLFCLCVKTALELINTSAAVNKLLLAREKRMAFGANFNTHVTLCGSGLDNFSASAGDRTFLIVGMDSFLHFFIPFLSFSADIPWLGLKPCLIHGTYRSPLN